MINLATYLEHSTTAHPDRTALIFNDRKWTFSQIHNSACQVANGLKKIDIVKGDRVTLFLPNCPEFFFFYFGILKTGAIVNPLNTMLKKKELEYLIGDCKPKVIVTTKELLTEVVDIFNNSEQEIKKIIVLNGETDIDIISVRNFLNKESTSYKSIDVDDSDIAAILYTSGTTGLPKGVMLTHKNLWVNGRHCADWAETTYKDITVCALPLFHSYALTHVLAELWMVAGTIVWFDRFDPIACFEAMSKYKATAFHGVGTMYYALVNHPMIDHYAKDINLRYSVTGAAPTPVPVLKAWNEKFIELSEGYGTTEASPVVMMNPLRGKGIQKPNSCGIPIVDEIEVAAVDLEGKIVKTGEIGELVVRGPNIMRGYWKKPKETQKTLINGWLHTGDLVYFDEDGYCFVKDRIKDMIITGGFNIYPKEIEDFLYTHPAIGEVQVVGSKDSEKGEIAVACIALKSGMKLTQKEVIAYCRENIAAYKTPRKIVFLDELPKTSTGKLQKVSLRKMIEEKNI